MPGNWGVFEYRLFSVHWNLLGAGCRYILQRTSSSRQLFTVTDKHCRFSHEPHSDPGIDSGRESSLARSSSRSEQWYSSLASSLLPPLSAFAPSLFPMTSHRYWTPIISLSGCSSWGQEVSLQWWLPYRISMPSKSVPIPFPVLLSSRRSPQVGWK